MSVDDALAQAQSVADPRDDPRRLHQVGSSQTLAARSSLGRPFSPGIGCGRSAPQGARSWPPRDPEDRAAHARAGGHPAAGLDDRAAGDDAVVLVPELQPAQPGRRQLGRVRSTTSTSTPIPPSSRRSGTRWSSCSGVLLITVIGGIAIALLIDQPIFGQGIVRILVISPFFVMPPVAALIWKNMIMHPGYGVFADIAQVLRPAADRLVRAVSAVLDHPHRRLAVAALRHADPADRAAVARRRADGGGRDGRRQLRQPLHLPDPAAHGPRDHRGDPDPDHLPARRLRRNPRHHQRRPGLRLDQPAPS